MKNLSPELLRRIDRLSGCRGRWIIDARAIEGNYGYAIRSLGEHFRLPSGVYFTPWDDQGNRKGGYALDSPEMAAIYCAETGWQATLAWHSNWLDDDCAWPGGYDAHSIIRSNARVYRDRYSKELERSDVDGPGPGLSLDVRFLSEEMIEDIVSLENYPLLDEDDHSELQLELQDEQWVNDGRQEWRRKVVAFLAEHAPDSCDDPEEWADCKIPPDDDPRMFELFMSCCESENQDWEEGSHGHFSHGFYINMDRVAQGLDLNDIRDLTGLDILSADQQWRIEPYPWEGAAPAPLLPSQG